MTKDIRAQFVAAGMELYPQYGYQKLSVRLLAAQAGVSSGMFHHVFVDKDEFVAVLLNQKRQQMFGQVRFDLEDSVQPVVQLRQAMWQFAVNIRDHLPWVHRVFADAANRVKVAEDFLRGHFSDTANQFLGLLNRCCVGTQSEQLQRLSYLSSAIMASMVLGTRLHEMGVLPETLNAHVSEILSDEAIGQRIDWAFEAVFAHQDMIKD